MHELGSSTFGLVGRVRSLAPLSTSPKHHMTQSTRRKGTYTRYNLALFVRWPRRASGGDGRCTKICVRTDVHRATLGANGDLCGHPILEEAPALKRIAGVQAGFARTTASSPWRLSCWSRQGKIFVLGNQATTATVLSFGDDPLEVWHGMRFRLLEVGSTYEVQLSTEQVFIETGPEPLLLFSIADNTSLSSPAARDKWYESLRRAADAKREREEEEEEKVKLRPVWEIASPALSPMQSAKAI